MTKDEIIAFISRISYKPETQLIASFAKETFENILTITLQTQVLDNRNCFDLVNISFYSEIPIKSLENVTESKLLQAIEEVILGWEKHEAFEWFKLDGHQVNPPH